MTALAPNTPERRDPDRVGERRRLIDAWRHFETSGDPSRLLETAQPLISARCAAAAKRTALDFDELLSDASEVLLDKKLRKKPDSPCVNDDHCVGRFQIMVRYSLLTAIDRGRTRRKNDADLVEQIGAVSTAPLSEVDRYIDEDEMTHIVSRLRRCQREALTAQEAKAVELAHFAEERLALNEVASLLEITDRGLHNCLTNATDKLRRCLHRYGVAL
ncbi:hypothetical protein Pla108_14340 [Botrimarina colliarenosi]|uniref:RNA polymerase sigma factor n=1 Tax=Botrimarina colliarenosi TaxID=2528001 RepID=A0A5C6AKC3_9BACT|nr:hypothetical protein [Botrimarina colliarenosi]TWU00483.1 hypothetical protein Pla108_14340 [Botrimarina colliarenosi]